MAISGFIAGYDPGGNGNHGVACLKVENNVPKVIKFTTVQNVNEAIRWLQSHKSLMAIGIDTLTILSTGRSGWRPADRWLRHKYPDVINSVVSPNSLHGSMTLSGLAVVHELRRARAFAQIAIIESHPKVLYYALCKRRYDFVNDADGMNERLGKWLSLPANTQSDHEWDAAISAYAAYRSLTKKWTHDLHALTVQDNESLVNIVGDTNFYWPE